MAQNIPNITAVSNVNSPNEFDIKVQNNNEADSSDKTGALDKTDENTYQTANFEDMSLEEVTEAALGLEQELMALEAEMDNLQMIIDANEEIKNMYKQQSEQLKKQLEQLQKQLSEAETPQDKQRIKSQMTGMRREIMSLSSQIQETLTIIQANNKMKADASSNYATASRDYNAASRVQNTKEAELNRSLAASQTSSSNSTGLTGVSNTSSTAPKGASTGKSSDNMISALKGWEGLRTEAYRCPAGVWTIGYGHTSGVTAGQSISEAQAEQYLRQDLASFENDVSSMAQSAGVKLSQGQFDALTSFAYNCGSGALQSSGILGMLKSGNIDAAASKLKEYVHGGGQVLPGLVSRRETEASWLYS